MPSLARRAIAEVYGTFILVFFGCGAVIMESFPTARFGLMGIALVHAIALSIAITATMAISGGHLNPAVTVGLWSTRRLPAADAFVYVMAQLAGALLAAFTARALFPAGVAKFVLWGTPTIYAGITPTMAVAWEALLTFFLVSAVMATVVSKSAPRVGGFAVGLTLFFAIMVGGPFTGAALNPARAFGPAVVSGNMQSLGIYFLGPLLGGLVAAQLWSRVLLQREDH
ncbi:MAG: aquaporin [Gemmatimonadota bacterium]